MRLTATRFFDASARWGFLVLFPGFIVYHYAVAAEWIPRFAGGLFGAVCSVLAVIGAVHVARRLHTFGSGMPGLERAFLLFWLYLLVWTLIASIGIATRAYVIPALMTSLATLSIWLAVYFVGSRFEASDRSRTWLSLSVLAVALVFGHAMVAHASVLGPFLTFQYGDDADPGEAIATYQGAGRSIMATAIVLAALQRTFWSQMFILVLSVLGLLCLGSRAHLFATVALLLTLAMTLGFRRESRKWTLLLLIALMIGGVASAELFLNTRAAEVFDLGQSASWQARLMAQSRALEIIAQAPFFGDFGYHHRPSEYAGYAHNILSVPAEFGGAAFLFFLALLVYALFLSATRVILRAQISPLWLAAFQANFTALLLALASEPIFSSVFPALGWGLTVNAIREERQRRLIDREIRDLQMRARPAA